MGKGSRLTPQDKKIHSYQHDRRNAYGEAGARSRFAIRRRKQLVQRANRRGVTQALDASLPKVAEGELLLRRPKKWEKYADVPLFIWLSRSNRERMGATIPKSPLVDEAMHRARRSNRGIRT